MPRWVVRLTVMIKNIVTVAGLVSAAVLSGAFIAQADAPAVAGHGAHIRAALPGSMAADFSCDGRPEGKYPNPADRTSYYYCVTGHPAPYLMQCPESHAGDQLYFNPETGNCDYEY